MKILKFKDFMKKYKLKNDTMMNLNYRKFKIILFTPEIVEYIQIEVL